MTLTDRSIAGTQLGRLGHKESDLNTGKQAPDAEAKASLVIEEYKRNSSKTKKWVVAETSIRVNCSGYSRSILAVALVIIAAALTVPFTVRNKIAGVDPFQFVSLAWLVAGAVLIGAKSRYVRDWPWHDFLRGQVVCKSITELAEVSSVPHQMILLYLLHNESKHTLTVSGPYTGMFDRVSEKGDAFVIDKPVQLSTALASGFLVFKVQNEDGEHIVCVDGRKSTLNISNRSHAKRNVCLDVGWDDDGQNHEASILQSENADSFAQKNWETRFRARCQGHEAREGQL